MNRRSRRALVAVGLALLARGPSPGVARAGAPSDEYRENLRRTIELRKQRRGTASPSPPGMIVPYPMPPALVIRQTQRTHDEIEALLDLLRFGSR